jgi:hypothetical protein
LNTNGYYQFHNWFDATAWYPLGRIIGGTIFPGLMLTSSVLHQVLHALNITIDIREVCVFLAPLFSSFTVIVAYLLTKEVQVGVLVLPWCFNTITSRDFVDSERERRSGGGRAHRHRPRLYFALGSRLL